MRPDILRLIRIVFNNDYFYLRLLRITDAVNVFNCELKLNGFKNQ